MPGKPLWRRLQLQLQVVHPRHIQGLMRSIVLHSLIQKQRWAQLLPLYQLQCQIEPDAIQAVVNLLPAAPDLDSCGSSAASDIATSVPVHPLYAQITCSM